MKIHQGAVLTRDPQNDMEAATKRYVDASITSSGAGLFVTDVSATSTGIVGTKVYVDGTTPSNAVIAEATSDTALVRVTFLAEGGAAFYSPVVTVDTTPGPGVVATLTEISTDKRSYYGYADIEVVADRIVYITSSTGSVAQVLIHRAAAAPSIQSFTIGSYPGSQTTAKVGDVMTVSGTVANTASEVDLLSSSGAVGSGTFTTTTTGGSLGVADSGGVGYKTFTVQFTVSSLSGLQSVTAKAKNSFGTFGTNITSSNQITLDQVIPTIGGFTVTYPAGQSALKGSEVATVTSTVTNYTSISYTSSADLSVANPSTYSASKSATRVGGNYVYGTNNYTITATKSTNGSSATASTSVNIANIAPTVAFTITGTPPRLVSSPTPGQSYTVTLTASQRLLSAPIVTATSGTLTSFTGSGITWTATLNIADTDPKGAQTFGVTSVVNLANSTFTSPTITAGQNYTVGGFTTRNVTIGALEQVVDLGVVIEDPTKVVVEYAGTADPFTYRGTDLSQFQKGWSLVDGSALVYTVGAEPFQNYSNFVFSGSPSNWFLLTDADFAGANTTGTLQITIGETA